MMRELFDAEEQAVLAMMLAGIHRGRIAGALGVSSSGLNLLLREMLRELGRDDDQDDRHVSGLDVPRSCR